MKSLLRFRDVETIGGLNESIHVGPSRVAGPLGVSVGRALRLLLNNDDVRTVPSLAVHLDVEALDVVACATGRRVGPRVSCDFLGPKTFTDVLTESEY